MRIGCSRCTRCLRLRCAFRISQGQKLPIDMKRNLTLVAAVMTTVGLFCIPVCGQSCADATDATPVGSTTLLYPFGGFAPEELTTPFTANSGQQSGGAFYFTITVTSDVRVQEISFNANAAIGVQLYCDVYRTNIGIGHAGNESNPSAWLAMSAGQGPAAGANQLSRLQLAEPMRLIPGTYGIALVANNFPMRSTIAPSTSFSDAVMTIDGGSATTTPFQGTAVARVPNVSIRYRVDGANGTNMRQQTIVPAALLSGAGPITGLAFAASGTGQHWSQALQVRMAHAPNGYSLSTSFNANMVGAVNVLVKGNHTWKYTADEWAEIGLTTPFYYDGTSDLVVEVIVRGNVQTSWGPTDGAFYKSSALLQRCYAGFWSGPIPATGAIDTSGIRMRFNRSCALADEFGASCGRLRARHGSSGSLGTLFGFGVLNALPNSGALLAVGQFSVSPLPISLTQLGWTNCVAFVMPTSFVTALTSPTGEGLFAFMIPNTPILTGSVLYGQWLQFDPSEPGGITVSDYTRVLVGQ